MAAQLNIGCNMALRKFWTELRKTIVQSFQNHFGAYAISKIRTMVPQKQKAASNRGGQGSFRRSKLSFMDVGWNPRISVLASLAAGPAVRRLPESYAE